MLHTSLDVSDDTCGLQSSVVSYCCCRCIHCCDHLFCQQLQWRVCVWRCWSIDQQQRCVHRNRCSFFVRCFPAWFLGFTAGIEYKSQILSATHCVDLQVKAVMHSAFYTHIEHTSTLRIGCSNFKVLKAIITKVCCENMKVLIRHSMIVMISLHITVCYCRSLSSGVMYVWLATLYQFQFCSLHISICI